jgi:magnesium transporter
MRKGAGNRDLALRHVVSDVPLADPSETVAQTTQRLRGRSFADVDWIYVPDASGRLAGMLELRDLLASDDDRRIGDLMRRPPVTAQPDTDQEKVLRLARHHRLTAVPVVEPGGRFIGAVPALALLDISGHEHHEDISRLAGIVHSAERATAALETSPLRRARDRLPWLLVGLVGSVTVTAVMSQFGDVIAADVAIAFFVPAIVYLADAIGTQTEAVAVRGLPVTNSPLSALLAGEFYTGTLVGGGLGGLAAMLAYIAFGDAHLALAVGVAILIAGSTASVCGLLLPWVLQHAGSDPAFGSGPVATVIQDLLTLLIYFGVTIALRAGV